MFKWSNAYTFLSAIVLIGSLIALFHYTDTHASESITQTASAANSTNGIIAYDGVLNSDTNSGQSVSDMLR